MIISSEFDPSLSSCGFPYASPDFVEITAAGGSRGSDVEVRARGEISVGGGSDGVEVSAGVLRTGDEISLSGGQASEIDIK